MMTYIYQLPSKLSDGYCFGGGRPIPFLNVDWFEVPYQVTTADIEQEVRHKGYFTAAPAGTAFLILSPLRPGVTSVVIR